MAKNENARRRILAIERILQNSKDGETVYSINDKLIKYYGISADRKTLYGDMAELTYFLPIETYKDSRAVKYRICNFRT